MTQALASARLSSTRVAGAQFSKALWWLCLATVTICLVACLASMQAQANPMAGPMGDLSAQQSAQQSGDYNNLENLISDLLDDAGNRLKKSKLSSMRQIKQTLRFGRRSDPLMAPTFGEHLAPNGNGNDHEQRRLLALDED